MGDLQTQIHDKLTQALRPNYLEVINESYKHAGHAGAGEETHFRLVISSPLFHGKSRVECHRLIYGVLAEEMRDKIHALAIDIS